MTGTKTFITNGPEADVVLVYAQLEERLTSFIVERSFAGFTRSEKIGKMGMRASTMCELIFDQCRVPASNLLGKEGGGVVQHDAQSRDRALDARGDQPRHRTALCRRHGSLRSRAPSVRKADRRVWSDPALHWRELREAAKQCEALTYDCGPRRSRPSSRNRLGTDAAKLFCATAAKEVADAAMQVLGGYGYCTEYRVEQFLRDAKLIEIGGGTIEAHQKNIARDLIRELS